MPNPIDPLIERVNNTFDGFNRLKSVESVKSGIRTVTDYQYNGDDLRVSKTVKKSDKGYTPEVTNYLYDRQHVVLETDGNGNVKTRYTRGINYIASQAGDSISYYLYNGHGDVTQTVTEAGEVQNQYDYDIFGNPTLTIEYAANAIRYAGEYFDNETGLYYLRARYYDPYTGRFISEDSYWGEDENPLSLNLYTYCHNDPVNFTDPSGHDSLALPGGKDIGQTIKDLGKIIKSTVITGLKKAAVTTAKGASVVTLTATLVLTPEETCVTTEQEEAELAKYNSIEAKKTSSSTITNTSNKTTSSTSSTNISKPIEETVTKSKKTQSWTANVTVKPAINGQYTVKSGDTLEVIAKANNTTVDALIKTNNITDSNKIYVGQTIKMPSIINKTIEPATNGEYIVKKGDTLSVIAKANGTTIETIAKENNISDPNKIKVDQVLKIPSGSGSPSPNNNNNKDIAKEITKAIIKETGKEIIKEVVKESSKETDKVEVKLPESDAKINHIFRDADGHLPDTDANRKLIQDTANNPDNYLGKDKYGNDWYAETREDGSQVWVQSRSGEIWDGGVNSQPRTWNDQTGLKNQQLPKK